MPLTNRDIASAFRFTLPQVRRWAVVACGIDPIADKGKGTLRLYSIDEAFKIYMVGELIKIYRMGLAEAKEHLNNLWPKLAEYNLLPSQDTEIKNNTEYVQIYIHSGYNYDFRIVIETNVISKDKYKMISVEKSKIISFRPFDLTRFKFDSPTWIIGFTYHLTMFRKELENYYKRKG